MICSVASARKSSSPLPLAAAWIRRRPSVRSLLPLFFRLKNVCLAICGIHCSLQTHWAPVTYYVCSGKGERSVPISYERANKLTVTRGRGSKMLQMSHVIGPLHEWRKRDMERWRERGRGEWPGGHVSFPTDDMYGTRPRPRRGGSARPDFWNGVPAAAADARTETRIKVYMKQQLCLPVSRYAAVCDTVRPIEH